MIQSYNFSLPAGELTGLSNTESFNPEDTWIALHGWLDNAASFIPLLKQGSIKIIAVDLPGHGLSYHRPEHSYYHFIDWLTDISLLINEISPDKPINLIGHSLGGLIATAFAGIYPDKVKQLAVIDAAGLVTQNTETPAAEIRQGLISRELIASKATKYYHSLDFLIQARAAAGDLDFDHAEMLMKRNTSQNSQGIYQSTDPRLKTMSPVKLSVQQARSIIQQVTAKTLLIKGKNGYDMVESGLQLYSNDYSDLTVVEIDGNHHCHMSHPEQVISALHNHME